MHVPVTELLRVANPITIVFLNFTQEKLDGVKPSRSLKKITRGKNQIWDLSFNQITRRVWRLYISQLNSHWLNLLAIAITCVLTCVGLKDALINATDLYDSDIKNLEG